MAERRAGSGWSAVVPRNHGPNVTLFAAMGVAGITAAMTMTGAADGEVWPLFVRQILVPSLRPGQIVIWDNLSVHKNQRVRQLIEAAAVRSASCRPIRRTSRPSSTPSASSRPRLRQANARTRPALEDAIAAGLATITPHDAAAWFRHCGYRLSEQLL